MKIMLQWLCKAAQKRFRTQRAELFRRYLQPDATLRILDVGGGYGDYFANVVPFRSNVWIGEIDNRILERAAQHGFQTALIPTDGHLPFPGGFFDIVHCNSVIEHVLVPEDRVRMASEIRRVGKRWFVQTPNHYFPLEPHTRVPFAQWLPRSLLKCWLPCMGRIWGYTDDLTWKLLDSREMRELFPDGRLVRERWAGLTKSLIMVGPQSRLIPANP
jgi:SAM-dependent methyltransferase